MNKQTLAIYFAGAAHRDQMYSERPYIFHLEAVDDILCEVGFSETHPVRIAAWLHDVVEDTDVTIAKIQKLFGAHVADLVWRVTNEFGSNRAERFEQTSEKIAGNEEAVALKLADRIANVEYSLKTKNKDKIKMYTNEYEEFRNELYDFANDKGKEMFNYLDTLMKE